MSDETKDPHEDYLKNQNAWIVANNIQLSDEVRIVKVAGSGESGWFNEWTDEMDDCLNKTFTIKRFTREYGIQLTHFRIRFSNYEFPYFVLLPLLPVKRD
ncbi:MAG: hypothetical protein ACUZ8H_16335 [Candidatus Anammoxibacter sp.]